MGGGKGGGGGGAQTVTNTSAAPSYLQPYVQDLAKQAVNLGNYQNPKYSAIQSQINAIDAQLKNQASGASQEQEFISTGGGGFVRNPNYGSGGGGSQVASQLAQQRQDLVNQLNGLSPTIDPASQLYSGSYSVDPSQASTDALAMLEQYGRNPSDIETSAMSYANSVLNGDYLNSNPYIDAVAQRAGRSLQTQYKDAVTGTALDAAGAGRYGSGLYQKAVGDKTTALTQGLTDLNTGIYYNNYNDERTRQQAMSAIAPQINQMGIDRANLLAGVGATRDNLAQQKRDEEIMRFEYARDYPAQQLDSTIQRIMALAGNGSTTTQNTTEKKSTGGLGSAIAGGVGAASLYGGLTGATSLAAMGPMGWGVAGLGALGGLLG